MKSFTDFLINEINGTNTLKKAVSSIQKSFQNPVQKQLNKIRKSINKSVLGNHLSNHGNREAREKMIKANASRIKRIQNTIKQNSVQN